MEILLIVAFFGLCVGSFLNVVIHRVPIMLSRHWREECHEFLELDYTEETESYNLFFPRSRCTHCNTLIHAWQNIPIFSYLFLRGKCGSCSQPISIRYPAIELITAILSIIVVNYFGVTWQAGCALLLTWSLISLTVIDFEHQLLPDNITLPVLWLGLCVNGFGVFASTTDALFGAVIGYLSLWIFTHAYKLITGKVGMGHGDFKLLALLGAWLGWQQLPFIIIASSIVGAILGSIILFLRGKNKDTPIPFGPFLAIAGWIALLFGNDITQWYANYAGF